MDITFLPEPLLTAIEINTRYVHVVPLVSKRQQEVLRGIKQIVEQEPSLRMLTTDNGTEFLGDAVQAYLKEKGITHYTNIPGDHYTMGLIERFHRTFKSLL